MEKPCPGWCWSRCREQGVRKADLHPEAFSSLLNKVCLGKESSALYKQPGVRSARRSEGNVRMMKRGLCARVLVWVDACRPAPRLPAMGPARGSRTPPGSDGSICSGVTAVFLGVSPAPSPPTTPSPPFKGLCLAL